MFKYLLVFPLFFLLPSTSIGDEVTLLLSSYHLTASPRPFNNTTPGLFYLKEDTYFGAYYNSLKKPSLAVGNYFHLTNNLSLTIGLATGYEHWLPQISLLYNYKKVNLHITPFTDKWKGKTYGGIVLSVSIKVWEVPE